MTTPTNQGHHPIKRHYPLPETESDSRFTVGLVLKVAGVLEQRGYPALDAEHAADLVELQNALFRFLYVGDRSRAGRSA